MKIFRDRRKTGKIHVDRKRTKRRETSEYKDEEKVSSVSHSVSLFLINILDDEFNAM